MIEKHGPRPVPLTIRKTYEDGTTETEEFPASIWQNGNTYRLKLARAKQIEALDIFLRGEKW